MPTTRRIATRTKARTWTAWLLLAVFIPIAVTTAWLWRGQVKRQNDQAFTAQAASIGASVTTAVRRMDDLTLAARTLLGSRPDMTDEEFNDWYHSMGVDERFAGVAGFSYVELVREQREDVYPAGDRPYYCLPKLGVAGPGMAETLGELTVPGPRPVPAHQAARRTRDSGEFTRSSSRPATATICSRKIAPV